MKVICNVCWELVEEQQVAKLTKKELIILRAGSGPCTFSQMDEQIYTQICISCFNRLREELRQAC